MTSEERVKALATIHPEIILAIQKAILEEREACAKIAETHLHRSGYMGGLSTKIPENSTAHDIALAIRARGEK